MLRFLKIRYRNILSTGNQWTEIRLDEHSTTLIIGKNGAGKSTLLDAICFVMFGSAFRNINKPNLVNSINGSGMEVQLFFAVGTKQYRIERGIKPNLFSIYCDDELINKDSASIDYQEYLEKNIFKFNKKSFTQIVILGSASFVPFMQLKAADRRAIIEDLLDIGIFSTMNKVNKEKMDGIKEAKTKIKYEIDLIQHKIELQKQNIKEHVAHDEEEIKAKQSDITVAQDNINARNIEISAIQKTVNEMVEKAQNKSSIESKVKKLLQLESKLEINIANIEKDIHFLCDTEDCPTCKQKIVEEFRKVQIEERNSKKLQLDQGLTKLREELSANNDILNEIASTQQTIQSLKFELSTKQMSVSSLESNIKSIQRDIDRIKARKDNLEEDNKKLSEFNEELEKLNKKEAGLAIAKHYYETAAILLKDTGVKTNIIRQYLPIINKKVNEYLESLNLFINFSFDENFKESIKSRHRDDFVYENFSEGEKQRIDLALLFTWRFVAKVKNSTNTNLLILDETFDSSMDDTDQLMYLLTSLYADTNIFVISHRIDQMKDKYQNVVEFRKKNNFSYIE